MTASNRHPASKYRLLLGRFVGWLRPGRRPPHVQHRSDPLAPDDDLRLGRLLLSVHEEPIVPSAALREQIRGAVAAASSRRSAEASATSSAEAPRRAPLWGALWRPVPAYVVLVALVAGAVLARSLPEWTNPAERPAPFVPEVPGVPNFVAAGSFDTATWHAGAEPSPRGTVRDSL